MKFRPRNERTTKLDTKEQLYRFFGSHIERPEVLTVTERNSLGSKAREEYDGRREKFLSGGIVLSTPHLGQAKVLLRQRFAENIGRNSGHTGLMLSGDSTLGKTTILKSLMQYVYNKYQRQFPDFEDHNEIPVVYIMLPAASTGKRLMQAFAKFFGLTVRSGETLGSLHNRVVDCLNAARTQLIVVDELHNLAGSGAGSGETSDLLKNLHNDLTATFMYAGIKLSESTALEGARGNQLAGRFSMLEMDRFNLSDPEDRKTWRGLIKAFEQDLLLAEHDVGSLAAHTQYLFDRTGGSIGSLGNLLTGSAIAAIEFGKRECIDLDLLETMTLDYAAEQYYLGTLAKKRPTPASVAQEMVA